MDTVVPIIVCSPLPASPNARGFESQALEKVGVNMLKKMGVPDQTRPSKTRPGLCGARS